MDNLNNSLNNASSSIQILINNIQILIDSDEMLCDLRRRGVLLTKKKILEDFLNENFGKSSRLTNLFNDEDKDKKESIKKESIYSAKLYIKDRLKDLTLFVDEHGFHNYMDNNGLFVFELYKKRVNIRKDDFWDVLRSKYRLTPSDIEIFIKEILLQDMKFVSEQVSWVIKYDLP
jgi:hypothetical protein